MNNLDSDDDGLNNLNEYSGVEIRMIMTQMMIVF